MEPAHPASQTHVACASLTELLPKELLIKIFCTLDSASEILMLAGLVCKSWFAIASDPSVWLALFNKKFRINRPAEFQIEIDWKRLYALSNASLPLELEKHVSARARMNLDQPEQRLTLLDDFFRGVQPDENGATPLWFRFDTSLNEWIWTPDHQNWMPITSEVVKGGPWSGHRPVPRNRTLLSIMSHYKLSPLVIYKKFMFYPSKFMFDQLSKPPEPVFTSPSALPPHPVLCSVQDEDSACYDDILFTIFEWLDPLSLAAAARVCTAWSKLIRGNIRRLCRLFYETLIDTSSTAPQELSMITFDYLSLFKSLWTTMRPKVDRYRTLRKELPPTDIWTLCNVNCIFDGSIRYDMQHGYQLGPHPALLGSCFVRFSPATLQWEWSPDKARWAVLALRALVAPGAAPRLLGEEMLRTGPMKQLLIALAPLLELSTPPIIYRSIEIRPVLNSNPMHHSL